MAKTEMYTTSDGERRFQISAPVKEETYQTLRLLAYEQETTLAAQVRKAADEYVARLKPPSSRIR
jgi:hypothetical protein